MGEPIEVVESPDGPDCVFAIHADWCERVADQHFGSIGEIEDMPEAESCLRAAARLLRWAASVGYPPPAAAPPPGA